ncbi:type II toxin-antitoxin system death-on-curing family toxin [Streptomyces sp. NPDC058877]|uniref:type II toxin-antitoxin system death-on-curing family toxin n=1 Tax=Streptomyces sp. NPDC058877 TaxID=3346665 RepID=UPI0036D19CF8
MKCTHLSTEETLIVAEYAVDDQKVVVRDAGLLDSATHRPSAAVFGEEAYPDPVSRATALFQSLAVNHPFVDGNKRTTWLSCVTFLAMNGIRLRPDIDAAERLVIAVTTGEAGEIDAIVRGLTELIDPDLR